MEARQNGIITIQNLLKLCYSAMQASIYNFKVNLYHQMIYLIKIYQKFFLSIWHQIYYSMQIF